MCILKSEILTPKNRTYFVYFMIVCKRCESEKNKMFFIYYYIVYLI